MVLIARSGCLPHVISLVQHKKRVNPLAHVHKNTTLHKEKTLIPVEWAVQKCRARNDYYRNCVRKFPEAFLLLYGNSTLFYTHKNTIII